MIGEIRREFPDEEPERHSSPDGFGEAAMPRIPQNQAVLENQAALGEQATVNRATIVVPGAYGHWKQSMAIAKLPVAGAIGSALRPAATRLSH
jgi:hypothetical protein